jgi:transposase
LAELYKIFPIQISQWKAQFLSNGDLLFEKGTKSPKDQAESAKDQLLKMIGQLKVEIDFLKNALR